MYQLLSKLVKEDNFLSLSGNLVIAIFGFTGFALLARSLDPTDFAQWVLFISGGSLIEMLRYGITNNGLVRFLAGATGENKNQLIGSNVLISLISTVILVILLMVINAVFKTEIQESSYGLFFKWYPLLALMNLPLNNAIVVQQAKLNYDKILLIRAINSVFFFAFLLVNFFFLELGVTRIVLFFILFNFITSLICLINSWDGFMLIKKSSRTTIRTLLNFGKYSSFTLIGTNLLRNADILIISISPFGSNAVALFSIPLKLTELQQIPLRSFVATAFPKMSKASLEGKITDVQNLFNVYSGAITYLFFLGSLVTFIFAKQFIVLVSGYQYLDVSVTNIDIVAIVRILSIYGLLLPIDRMTGIGLDSINKPEINAYKVLIMLLTNIIGDLVAIYIFKSVEMVAVSTLLFTSVGIVMGCYFLNKNFKILPHEIIKSTNVFYKSLWHKTFAFVKQIKKN